MKVDTLLIVTLTFAALISALYVIKNREKFDIPLGRSSGWGWNTGPGYGAGYGTGYAMWGIWPSNIPTRPWRNWMWGRRPLWFQKRFYPEPQIDYGYRFV